MSPIAPRIEIAEIEMRLLAFRYGGYGTRDLARHECLAASRPLMVEQDSVGGMKSISVPVVHGDPIGVKLRRGVWTARLEGRCLALWRFLRHAVEFGG